MPALALHLDVLQAVAHEHQHDAFADLQIPKSMKTSFALGDDDKPKNVINNKKAKDSAGGAGGLVNGTKKD